MSPPRLTGALRSFSTVSKQEDFTQDVYDLKVRLKYSFTCCFKPLIHNLSIAKQMGVIRIALMILMMHIGYFWTIATVASI